MGWGVEGELVEDIVAAVGVVVPGWFVPVMGLKVGITVVGPEVPGCAVVGQ